MRRYRQVKVWDRVVIEKCFRKGLSFSEIGKATGFSRSTICRELKRNHCYRQAYRGVTAQRKRDARNKVATNSRPGSIRQETREWIKERLLSKWSPEQISGRSRIDGPQPVSHEYIYRMVKQDKKERGRLFLCLRRARKHSYHFHGIGRSKILNRADISTRPKIVEKRIRLGDLEGDLIVGRHQLSHIAVVADRVSRLVGLEKVRTKANGEVNGPLRRAIERNGQGKTLTLDNGLEFSEHRRLSAQTGLKIYFAHAYAAWERGTVENMNRLLRQYLPKKTDFRKVSSEQLRQIEDSLNNRPRKCLGYRTPNERHFG